MKQFLFTSGNFVSVENLDLIQLTVPCEINRVTILVSFFPLQDFVLSRIGWTLTITWNNLALV